MYENVLNFNANNNSFIFRHLNSVNNISYRISTIYRISFKYFFFNNTIKYSPNKVAWKKQQKVMFWSDNQNNYYIGSLLTGNQIVIQNFDLSMIFVMFILLHDIEYSIGYSWMVTCSGTFIVHCIITKMY